MLDELHVRDYALVQDARLEFSQGLTVLSGETGAGKTALVGAIKLLIGERAEVMAIRDGATELMVEGRFVLTDQEHVISRRLNREGRSRCSLDGNMATVGTLADKIGPLVDLHGQHEHQSLLTVASQLDYLDRYAGREVLDALAIYQQALAVSRKAHHDLEALRHSSQVSEQSLKEAQHTLDEINAVDPQPGEYQQLETQLPILRNGESLALASQSALEALRNEDGALDQLASACRALAQQAGVDKRLDNLAAQLESLSITAEDLAAELRAYRESVEFDPQALEDALSRMSALEGLRKRYGPRMEDVFDSRDEAAMQLSLTGDLASSIHAAQVAADRAEQELAAAAGVLAQARAQAAEDMANALNASLADLAMEGAMVQWALHPLERQGWNELGSVRYELMYKPSRASQARPLAKIASGGELSRMMLALKTLISPGDEQVTLVFDEVDAGIGGNTATAVAQRIYQLAQDHQVIVVTHLAQIAAVAHRQFVVEKSLDGEVATTMIREVQGEQRVAEVARMLSGHIDQVACEHARLLLERGQSANTAGIQRDITLDAAVQEPGSRQAR